MLGGKVGAPELFLLLNLLLNEDCKGCPAWLAAGFETVGEGKCEDDRNSCFGLLETTVGLKVTVRCGLGGMALPAVAEWDRDGIRGVVSFELDAMLLAPGFAVELFKVPR